MYITQTSKINIVGKENQLKNITFLVEINVSNLTGTAVVLLWNNKRLAVTFDDKRLKLYYGDVFLDVNM